MNSRTYNERGIGVNELQAIIMRGGIGVNELQAIIMRGIGLMNYKQL